MSRVQTVGPMQVRIQTKGTDIRLDQSRPVRKILRNSTFKRYDESISSAVNSVVGFFRAVDPDAILSSQFTVDMYPGAELRSDIQSTQLDPDEAANRISFHLSIVNNRPCLVGQGSVFTPIPLGSSSSSSLFSHAQPVERAAFAALLENFFNEVSEVTIGETLGVLNPTLAGTPDETVRLWMSKEDKEPLSPWSISADTWMSRFVKLSGESFAWNK